MAPGKSGPHEMVDLSQDLIEEDVFDVHGEKLSKRTLFGRTKSQGSGTIHIHSHLAFTEHLLCVCQDVTWE